MFLIRLHHQSFCLIIITIRNTKEEEEPFTSIFHNLIHMIHVSHQAQLLLMLLLNVASLSVILVMMAMLFISKEMMTKKFQIKL